MVELSSLPHLQNLSLNKLEQSALRNAHNDNEQLTTQKFTHWPKTAQSHLLCLLSNYYSRNFHLAHTFKHTHTHTLSYTRTFIQVPKMFSSAAQHTSIPSSF